MTDNLTETNLTDLWRYRAEHKEQEDYAHERRRNADQELFKRAKEADATILQTDAGPVEIAYPNTYAYDSVKVDGPFFALIERDGLQAEYNQFVRHTYRINKTWLNRLAKRGGEYREAIEKMTIAGTGSPSIKGPELAEMGNYAPREEQMA